MKKILSAVLAFVMVIGSFMAVLPFMEIPVYAASDEVKQPYIQATDAAVSHSYGSALDRINGSKEYNYVDKMDLSLTLNTQKGKFQLYVSPYTGEVIYYNATTGEALTTNPINVGSNELISSNVKAKLMSQVVVCYKDTTGNLQYMYSYTEAAQRGQIQVKNIKNGIRVLYTIGRENATYLLPRWITEETFREKIMTPIMEYMTKICDETGIELPELHEDPSKWTTQFSNLATRGGSDGFKDYPEYSVPVLQIAKFLAKYKHNSPDFSTEEAWASTVKKFETAATYKDANGETQYRAFFTFEDATEVQKAMAESYLKTFCPDYGYDDLDEDHAETGYVSKEATPPLFKLSLEYTIDPTDGALNVRLPANGIRYDETRFQLEYISPLNYFGAGFMSTDTYADHAVYNEKGQLTGLYGGEHPDEELYSGYVFYPDGSGTLFDFNKLYTDTKKSAISWSGKVYGQDYAYYTVSGQNQEVIRLPVYGIVSTSDIKKIPIRDGEGNHVINSNGRYLYEYEPVKTGFLAMLEEGDALANIAVSFDSMRHNYASVYTTYYPRPKDTYDLSDSLSVSGNTEWTVVADRKYTGSYRTRIVMLSDSETSEYPATWVGMATAYRDYLEKSGILSRLTEEEVKDQIPLYIETFGAIETTKQILSVPVTVKVPLSSFADVKAMYDDLKLAGITNVNFKLTGFANGGMVSTYPTKLKWEKAVGGSSGFSTLIKEAEENGFGVYPEFDFSYISHEKSFDGISLKGAGARTVDNRYCSKQIYNAVYQKFESFFDMCVATNVIETYYDKLSGNLSKYQEDGSFGISVSTLGSDLNSSFDEDNPINREEAKGDINRLLTSIKKTYGDIMTSGGNAYTLAYTEHLLNMPIDSSNYRQQSASVPFMGMVLHGYVNYAGSALNLAGDTDYNLLKSIESGASPYFLLSYNAANTMLLKQDETLNKYYSIRYDIWRYREDPFTKEKTDGSVVEHYNRLNSALGDLQTFVLSDHVFLIAERSLKDYEITNNKEAIRLSILSAIETELKAVEEAMKKDIRSRLDLYNLAVSLDNVLQQKVAEDAINPGAQSLYSYIFDDSETAPFFAFSEELKAIVYMAYNDGEGLDQLCVQARPSVKVNVDYDALWASVLSQIPEMIKKQYYAMTGTTLSEELVALKNEILAFAEEDSYTGEFNVLTKLAEIYARTVTDEELAVFNQLVYSIADEATIRARFSETLSGEALTQYVNLVLECRDKNLVFARVNSVTVGYDFNLTDSLATETITYDKTDYTLEDERLVMVTYSNATKTTAATKEVKFILNYNIFDVNVRLDNGEVITMKPYSCIRINVEGGNLTYVEI